MSIEPRKRLDTWSRLGGRKQLPSLEEGRAAFARVAQDQVPRYVKVHRAWTVALVRCGGISADRGRRLLGALEDVDVEEMIATYDERYDKVVLQLERYLVDRIGSEGSSVLAGRTLPPPVYRMRVRERILPLIEAAHDMLATLLEKSAEHARTVMPGYTHLSHAQPTTYGHYLLGVHDACSRSARQIEMAYDSTNLCDMGCGALAGTSFPVDRGLLAGLLGFGGIVEHSNDCVAATDYAVDLATALTNMAIPISRAAGELDTWTTFEAGMLEISDEIGATSSMMPQKKNATLCEHLRWALGSVSGMYAQLATGCHAVPYGDVMEVMFVPDVAIELAARGVRICSGMAKLVNNLHVNAEVMLRHARDGFSTASELAAVIFRRREAPWRACHAIVAGVVRRLAESGRTAADITPALVDEIALEVVGEKLGLSAEEISAAIDPVRFVEAHRSQGGVAPDEVLRMIAARREELARSRAGHRERLARLEAADRRLDAAAQEITAPR